jgi:hypothetical protein
MLFPLLTSIYSEYAQGVATDATEPQNTEGLAGNGCAGKRATLEISDTARLRTSRVRVWRDDIFPALTGEAIKPLLTMSELHQNQDTYREGLFARALGRSCRCNPYPEDSDAAARWIHGWWLIDENAPSALARESEQGSGDYPAQFHFDDAPPDVPMEQAKSALDTLLEDAVEMARTIATGLLLAIAGFTSSYLVLRLFAF